MVVREETAGTKPHNMMVAADVVGAGIGERVLVVSGSTARRVFGRDDIPVDCTIVGIIDSVEISPDAK